MDKKTNQEGTPQIPMSVVIANTKMKLEQIINSPLLPVNVLELIIGQLYMEVSMKAQQTLEMEYKDYKSKLESEKTEKVKGES
jgi:hypothetical protein